MNIPTVLDEHEINHTLVGGECLIINTPLGVDKIPGFLDGKVSVQDFGAQLAAHLIDLKKGHKVLDACSAPGGKACHMLELNSIELLAIESDKKRTIKIQENIDREGFKAKVLNEK